MSSYKGKWAAITGAGHGIGEALATKCAMLGINVILIDIDFQALTRIKSQFSIQYPSIKVLSYKCDISEEKNIKDMVIKLKSDYYSINNGLIPKNLPIIIHFLFNNAGVSSFTNVLNGDLNRMHKTMNINLWGMIYMTQLFLPFLQSIDKRNKMNNNNKEDKDERFIINTSSVAGLATADSFYAVTKHGVCSLSEVFEAELKGYNKKCKKEENGRGVINVSCLIPSYVKSSFFDSTAKVHDIKNIMQQLRKEKIYNSGRAHPDIWSVNGIDPMIVADIVFDEGIKKKLFWIHTHQDWSKCVSVDRFYSIYTQKFNQYEATKKVFKKYQDNMKRILKKNSKL